MNGEREPGLSPNEQAIMEKELPGRSLLENKPELALSEKESTEANAKKYAEVIKDDEGQEVWRKDIAYVREPDPEREGKHRDTDAVKAITERTFDRNDKGLVTKETGTNLDREHSFEKAFEYDDEGNLTKESGQVTEGEKKGETWETTRSVEKVGDYSRETVTDTGKKMVDGKLEDFKTTEVKYTSSDGKHVYGYHIAPDGERTMGWGEKPADLQE